jgi:hypothetical protein
MDHVQAQHHQGGEHEQAGGDRGRHEGATDVVPRVIGPPGAGLTY